MERIIFHIDVNSAFLSWEACHRIHHLGGTLDLRTIPSAVGGDQSKRHGIILTKSIPAKKYHIKTGEPIVDARRKCPELVIVPPNYTLYSHASRAMIEILEEYTDIIEKYSIDEAFLDVSPGRFVRESPVAIAARIQQRVSELGITCSIGVASGKSVAKIASDLDKPRGLTVVYPGSERAFLAPMEVRAMPGIGKQSALKLQALGIRTLGDLASAQPSQLKGVFGVNAAAFAQRAAGIDERPLVTESQVKSVSNERTFTRDLTSRAEIEAAIDYLGCMVGRRLRKQGLAGHTVTLKLRYSDLSSRTAQHSISAQVDDESVFIPIAKQLLEQVWRPGDSVRLVGIGIGGFHEKDQQMELFGDGSAEELPAGNPALVSAADKVRDRFGDGKLVFGRQLKLTVETTANPNRDASS